MEGYLSKISKNIKLHLKRISSNVPNYMHPLITDIGNIIDNFLKEERILIPENHEI